MRGLWTLLGAAALLPAAISSARACPWCKSPFAPGTYTGQAQRMGHGLVYTWVELDAKGKPATVGVTLTAGALNGLTTSADASMEDREWMIDLPRQAVKSGFTHVVINWNPQGHEPEGIYTVPHFDMHFYLMKPEERERITAVGADLAVCRKPVPSRYMASGFIYASGAETARMGGHWADPGSPEFHGQPFAQTFIYGSYGGRLTFLEPMIARSFLESHPDVSSPVRWPAAVEKNGYYPSAYSVRYDAERGEYVVALTGLKWREAAAPARRAQPRGRTARSAVSARRG